MNTRQRKSVKSFSPVREYKRTKSKQITPQDTVQHPSVVNIHSGDEFNEKDILQSVSDLLPDCNSGASVSESEGFVIGKRDFENHKG
jgi:hypothetical protein